jgi:hypothetical protein
MMQTTTTSSRLEEHHRIDKLYQLKRGEVFLTGWIQKE